MSDGYRNGAFALGLVTGAGIALNIFLWLDYAAKQTSDEYPDVNSYGGSNEVGGYWEWMLGAFVSPSDTLAQWIMAILTIAAVFLLWRTLVQTNKTNESAIMAATAALEANEIMRLEQRPWVTVLWDVPCKFEKRGEDGWHLEWQPNLANKGRSPAFNVRFNWDIIRLDTRNVAAVVKGVDHIVGKAKRQFNSISNHSIIFPGEATNYRQFTGTSVRTLGDNKGGYFICICVTYSLDSEGKVWALEARILGLTKDGETEDPDAHKALNWSGFERLETWQVESG